MTEITTIVHFTLPEENKEEFLVVWHQIANYMTKQPGALHGTFYRCVDTGSPFQFINVARWESAEALTAALANSAADAMRQDVDVRANMARLGVRVSQNNYVVEKSY